MGEICIDSRVLERAREVLGAARSLVSNIQLAAELRPDDAPYQRELIATLAGAVSRQLFELEPMLTNAPLPPTLEQANAEAGRAARERLSWGSMRVELEGDEKAVSAAVNAGAEVKQIVVPPMYRAPANTAAVAEDLEHHISKGLQLEAIVASKHVACRAPSCSADATWCITGAAPRRELGYSCSEHIYRVAGDVAQRNRGGA